MGQNGPCTQGHSRVKHATPLTTIIHPSNIVPSENHIGHNFSRSSEGNDGDERQVASILDVVASHVSFFNVPRVLDQSITREPVPSHSFEKESPACCIFHERRVSILVPAAPGHGTIPSNHFIIHDVCVCRKLRFSPAATPSATRRLPREFENLRGWIFKMQCLVSC